MFDYSVFVKEMEELKEQGLYIYIRTLEGPQGSWLTIGGKKVLNMCSNNYLGFANEPRLKEAAKRAIDKWGVGPGAVRTIAGTLKIHEELEKALAEFKKVEAVLFLQTGFIANQAVIPAIVEAGDAILSDELNHASIIDGVRLSKAERYIWKHRDVKDLEEKLKEATEKGARRKLIITDGVFSMDGDLAPLPEIVELAEKYDAMVMVDDAHGEGVLGEAGRGIVDHFGLRQLNDRLGIEALGHGFTRGSQIAIDHLRIGGLHTGEAGVIFAPLLSGSDGVHHILYRGTTAEDKHGGD